MDRRQLVEEMGIARERVMEAVAGLSEEQASKRGIEGWSVKDHLNHLTACDEFRFFEIGRVARGGSPASRDMDSEQADVLNGLIVTLRRGLPMEQVVADLRSVRERVLEAIAAAPEHALSGEAYGDFPVDGSISHDAEHAAAIREWRQREGI